VKEIIHPKVAGALSDEHLSDETIEIIDPKNIEILYSKFVG
jgi:hypothetical protein